MKKKLILAALGIAAALFMLTGCGEGDAVVTEAPPVEEEAYEEPEVTPQEPQAAAPLLVSDLLDGTWDLYNAQMELMVSDEVEGISGPSYSITFADGRYTVTQYISFGFGLRADLGMPFILLPHIVEPPNWAAVFLQREPLADDWDPELQEGAMLHRVEDSGYFYITERTLITNASIQFHSDAGRIWVFDFAHSPSDVEHVPDTFSIIRPVGAGMNFRMRQ